MKICLVAMNIVPYFTHDASSQFGGAEVQAAVLASGFKAAGADVSLVVSNLDEGSRIPFPAENAFFSKKGAPVLRFFHPRLSGIWKALERADADIYYQHCAGMISGVTALFCRIKGRIFVYGAGSNTDFSLWTSRVRGLRDKLLFYLGLKLAHGIVAQNQVQMRACVKNLGKNPRVFPCAVDFDEGALQSAGKSIAWIGAIREVKRPELFVELARRLPDERFIMVGGSIGTEEGLAEHVRAMADNAPNLEVKGRILHHEVLELLKNTALLVNTSRIEGFPNVYLEAWKYGIPVVSFTDVDGLIAKEEAGVICGDLQEMADEIKRLMGNEQERFRLGKRGRELVRNRFAASAVAKEYLVFFEELMGKKSGGLS